MVMIQGAGQQASSQEVVSQEAVQVEEKKQGEFPGTPWNLAQIREALLHAYPDGASLVGTTSVSIKVDLAGAIDSNFKPKTKKHPEGYLYEVGAFRIAQALGMDNVPPSFLYKMDKGKLRRRLNSEEWIGVASEIIWSGDEVLGSNTLWVPALSPDRQLESRDGIAVWKAWLSEAEIPDDKIIIAADVSTLLFFDYLIGNPDRWSGGNIRLSQDARRVMVRDHNLAFSDLSESSHEKMLQTLSNVRKISRSFYEKLLVLDETSIQALMKGTSDFDVLALSAEKLKAIQSRRATLLSYITARIESQSESTVLLFP